MAGESLSFDDVHVPLDANQADGISGSSTPPKPGASASVEPPPEALKTLYMDEQVGPDGRVVPSYSGPDYQPNPSRKLPPHYTIRQDKPHGTVERERPQMEADGHLIDLDYQSSVDSAGRHAIRDATINRLSRQMYDVHETDRDKFLRASLLVQKCTSEQLDDAPNAEVRNALAIVAEGEPYTKEICDKRARQQVVESEAG